MLELIASLKSEDANTEWFCVVLCSNWLALTRPFMLLLHGSTAAH